MAFSLAALPADTKGVDVQAIGGVRFATLTAIPSGGRTGGQFAVAQGQSLEGMVVSIDHESVVVQIGNQRITAATDASVRPGDLLRLLVRQTGPDQVLMQIVGRGGATPAPTRQLGRQELSNELTNLGIAPDEQSLQVAGELLARGEPLTAANVLQIRSALARAAQTGAEPPAQTEAAATETAGAGAAAAQKGLAGTLDTPAAEEPAAPGTGAERASAGARGANAADLRAAVFLKSQGLPVTPAAIRIVRQAWASGSALGQNVEQLRDSLAGLAARLTAGHETAAEPAAPPVLHEGAVGGTPPRPQATATSAATDNGRPGAPAAATPSGTGRPTPVPEADLPRTGGASQATAEPGRPSPGAGQTDVTTPVPRGAPPGTAPPGTTPPGTAPPGNAPAVDAPSGTAPPVDAPETVVPPRLATNLGPPTQIARPATPPSGGAVPPASSAPASGLPPSLVGTPAPATGATTPAPTGAALPVASAPAPGLSASLVELLEPVPSPPGARADGPAPSTASAPASASGPPSLGGLLGAVADALGHLQLIDDAAVGGPRAQLADRIRSVVTEQGTPVEAKLARILDGLAERGALDRGMVADLRTTLTTLVEQARQHLDNPTLAARLPHDAMRDLETVRRQAESILGQVELQQMTNAAPTTAGRESYVMFQIPIPGGRDGQTAQVRIRQDDEGGGPKRIDAQNVHVVFQFELQNLGTVRASLRVLDRHVSCHLGSSQAAATALLDQHAPDLRDGLSGLGYLVDDLRCAQLTPEEMRGIDADRPAVPSGRSVVRFDARA